MTPTPSLSLSFSLNVESADQNRRIIAGKIVPFGDEIGNTSVGPVRFEAGSIDYSGKVKLLLEHRNTEPIGFATKIEERSEGLWAEFSVAQTTRGNDALIEASTGLRDGFSVGVEVVASKPKQGALVVSKSYLREVSLVESAAFKSAAVERVAASEDVVSAEATAEAEIQTEKETEMADMVNIAGTIAMEPVEVEAPETSPSVEDAAPAVSASAAQVQAAKRVAPVFVTERVAPLTGGDYLKHKIFAAMGDRESARIITAADDSTATNTGLTLPQTINEFVVDTFATRPTIDAIGVQSLEGISGMSYNIPTMVGGTAPTVADTNEGAAPSETGMTSSYQTVQINKFMGLQRVSFELMERSLPSFGELMLRELQKAYSKATDTAVIAALTAGGTQATAASGDIAGLQAFIATEGPAAYIGTGGDYATELVASSAWWTALLSANDSTDRPLFPTLGPVNTPGAASAQSSSANVFGTNFRVDHNIATAGLIDESAFLIAPASVEIRETPTTQLRVNVLTTGEIEVSLHGYLSVAVIKPKGVRRFNLT